jgi:NADPH:quinone reductase-like Zn-dependent oxidoreductase
MEKIDTGHRLKLVTAPVPKVGDRQVLVRVRAVALNRGDYEILRSKRQRDYTNVIAASDAAGDIVAVGRSVEGFKVGDRVTSLYFKNWVDGPASDAKLDGVLGRDTGGVLGEYVVLDDTTVVRAPASLSYEEAATLPTAGLTAWNATIGQFEVKSGDVVLVQGTGGVSIFALQFAVANRARVIVTSSSDDKLQRVRELGAAEGINYRTHPTWSEQVSELTQKQGASLIVDVGGKSTLDESVKGLAYGGVLSIVGGLTGYDGTISALGLLNKTARAQGIYVGSRADYVRMGRFIDARRLKPVIDKVFPFEDYEAAFQHLESGNFVGKVVIRL